MLWILGLWGLFVVVVMLVIRKLMSGKAMGGDLPEEERKKDEP
jgi:hypothetical protein